MNKKFVIRIPNYFNGDDGFVAENGKIVRDAKNARIYFSPFDCNEYIDNVRPDGVIKRI